MKQVMLEESGAIIYVEEFDKGLDKGEKLHLHLPTIGLKHETVLPVIYQEQLSNGTIYFKTDDIAELTICLDARILNNRAVSIYDSDDEYPIEWYSIKEMPFDRSFFKVGHAYLVRKNRGGNLSPMLLHSMDFKTLCFMDSCGEKEIITCDRYKNMKKSYWFAALMDSDHWTGELKFTTGDNV